MPILYSDLFWLCLYLVGDRCSACRLLLVVSVVGAQDVTRQASRSRFWGTSSQHARVQVEGIQDRFHGRLRGPGVDPHGLQGPDQHQQGFCHLSVVCAAEQLHAGGAGLAGQHPVPGLFEHARSILILNALTFGNDGVHLAP